MSTTALAVELLVIGYQTIVWLVLLFALILLIGVFSIIHLYLSDATWSKILLAGASALVGAYLAYWAWYETAENYYFHLRETYKALKRGRPEL